MAISNKIIGIDLGTTNSCVSVVEGNQAKIITYSGNRTTPSVVHYKEDGSISVGITARREAVLKPKQTINAVKRLIGRRFNDKQVQQEIIPHVSYDLCAADNGDAWIKTNDKKISPQQVSAEILRKLKEAAESYLGATVKKAVITVPAYFDDAQRQATKDAGTIAGLEVERIINEPTAAALSYESATKRDHAKMAVYDLGGGTFDVSIIEVNQVDGHEQVQVLSTNGNTALGGEDFDNLLIQHLISEFKNSSGIDCSNDALAIQRIKEAAERAKIELSTNITTQVSLPYLSTNANGPQNLSVSISRSKLESMVSSLLEGTIKPCRQALQDASLQVSDIDEVLLVGGQTRMPLVKQIVEGFFGKNKVRQNVNADEAVSLGAAIQGGVLSGDVQDVLLLDVTPLSLGIETVGDVFTKIIERNTTIPTKKSQVFSTAQDNQTSVSIQVYQGERSTASTNKLLGTFQLDGIKPAAKQVPQIEVEFDLNTDGILNITAKDKDTGKSQHISVTGHGGLNEEEIESMKRDAEANADADARFIKLVTLRNKRDSLISVVEEFVKKYGQQIPTDRLKPVQDSLSDVAATVDSKDIELIEGKIKKLEESFSSIRDMDLKQEKVAEDVKEAQVEDDTESSDQN